MTRRTFLSSLSAACAWLSVPFVARAVSSGVSRGDAPALQQKRFRAGHDTLPDGYHVFLDDKPVCSCCSEFDTSEGWARLYPVDDKAGKRLKNGYAMTLRGRVEVRHTGVEHHKDCW